jgi:zinc transporter ZupT
VKHREQSNLPWPTLTMNLFAAKISLIFLVGFGTFIASLTPWIAARYLASRKALDFISYASALSAGIVLGALLCHLLPEASESYNVALSEIYGEDAKIAGFPFAGLTCGLVLAFLVSIDALIVRRGFDEVVSHEEHLANGEHAHGADHITAALQRLAAQQQQQQLRDLQNGVVAASDLERLPLKSPAATKAGPTNTDGDGASSSAVPVLLKASHGGASTPEMRRSSSKRMASIEVDFDSASKQRPSLSSSSRAHSHRNNALTATLHAAAGGVEGCEDCYVAVGAESPSRSSVNKTTTLARVDSEDGIAAFAATAAGASAEGAAGEAGQTSATVLRARKSPAANSTSTVTVLPSAAITAAQKAEQRRLVLRAWVFFTALSLHGVFDGMSVASEEDPEGFISTLIAVLSHKAFDGIALGVAIYPASGHLPAYQKWLLLIVSALSTPVGIAIGMGATALASGDDTQLKLVNAIAISLASGSFAFISLMELLPSSISDNRLIPLKLALFIASFLAMAGLAYVV